MAREINLIGYSKGVDDFISNGMSMQRTIPYSGDDAREHHEQKLLPGLSISAGEATEYDGPFAVKMTGDTTLYVNPGNAYNNGSLLAQWEGGELSLPEEVADGIWRVVVYPETGTLKCGLASGYLYFQFAELAMVTVEDGKIKSIAEKWERGHLYLSFYLGMFSVIRYTDTSVWVNPGSVRNGGKAYAEYPGGVVELSSQEDGRLFLYAIPDQGGVTVVMSSTSLDYAFKMIATIRVREGKIYSIVQDWDDGVIASELSSAVFAMTRYSDTSVSINAGSAMCYGNNSNLTYENVRFEENGETVLLDLGGLACAGCAAGCRMRLCRDCEWQACLNQNLWPLDKVSLHLLRRIRVDDGREKSQDAWRLRVPRRDRSGHHPSGEGFVCKPRHFL